LNKEVDGFRQTCDGNPSPPRRGKKSQFNKRSLIRSNVKNHTNLSSAPPKLYLLASKAQGRQMKCNPSALHLFKISSSRGTHDLCTHCLQDEHSMHFKRFKPHFLLQIPHKSPLQHFGIFNTYSIFD
jgi:hypothetical protein